MAETEANDLDFYQTDYTNASPWETFTFNLEEKLSGFRSLQDIKVKRNEGLQQR